MSYRLRHHSRARRLKLRVERDGELVVTAPRGLRRREIDGFVKSQEAWIAGVRERLARERARRDPASSGARPACVELPAVGETWRIEYGGNPAFSRAGSGARAICLPGQESDAAIARRLQDWLKRHARRKLSPWIDSLAREHGFEFNRVSFRNQKSRWGSCSSNGNLSLNARLLFCSPEACRYVLIHELVHLEHPNHSPRFWQRVGELYPDYRFRMRELKIVWNRLPDWVTAS